MSKKEKLWHWLVEVLLVAALGAATFAGIKIGLFFEQARVTAKEVPDEIRQLGMALTNQVDGLRLDLGREFDESRKGVHAEEAKLHAIINGQLGGIRKDVFSRVDAASAKVEQAVADVRERADRVEKTAYSVVTGAVVPALMDLQRANLVARELMSTYKDVPASLAFSLAPAVDSTTAVLEAAKAAIPEIQAAARDITETIKSSKATAEHVEVITGRVSRWRWLFWRKSKPSGSQPVGIAH